MQLANQEAQRINHEYIGTEHILLGLVKEGSGVAANVLKNLDVDLRKIRLEVEKIVQSGPDMDRMGKLPQTPRAKKVIEYAMEEARNLNHNYVGTEHLLLGLLREQEGVAAQVLMNLGLKLEDVRDEVLNLHSLGGGQLEGVAQTDKPESEITQEQRYRHHPIVSEMFAEIERLNSAKEESVADQDFEKAAAFREQEDGLRRKVQETCRLLAEQESISESQDAIRQFCRKLMYQTGECVRPLVLDRLIRELIGGNSVLVVGAQGSGRRTLAEHAASELLRQSAEVRRLPMRMVLPDFRAMCHDANDADHVTILMSVLEELSNAQAHLMAIPELHQFCDPRTVPADVADAWKLFLGECRNRNVPLLAWSTPEKMQTLADRWPGLLVGFVTLQLDALSEDAVSQVVSEEMLSQSETRLVEFDDHFTARILAGRVEWRDGAELVEPGRTVQFIRHVLGFTDGDGVSEAGSAFDPLACKIRELKGHAMEAVRRDDFTAAEQIFREIRRLKSNAVERTPAGRPAQISSECIEAFLGSQHVR